MNGLSSFKAFVEEVRNRSNLVDIVGRDVELRRVGNVLKGLSPFHEEKHASFVVWPTTQSWHDYSNGGGLGGDVFTYVQEREKVGFKDAVLWLADRAGIRPPNGDDASWKRELALADERRQIEHLLTLAATYYHRALPPAVRDEYYKQRYGFTDETIDQLQLGWSDGHLFEHLTRTTGATRRRLLGTGLFVPLKGGGVVDFFCNRLVFPYWRGGRVVYFTARATEHTGDESWEQAKYRKLRVHAEQQRYISPTVRNDYFFNEDAARGTDELVLTEGVPDCISAWQCGVASVSPGTTSLRSQDLPRLLELTRQTKRIIICNDSEASGAGDRSALAIAAHLWAEGREVCIASIPRPEGVDKIDLNELVTAQGAEGLHAVLAQALAYPEFLLARIPMDSPRTELDPLLEPVLDAIGRCPPIRADVVLDAITAKFGIRRQALRAALKARAPRPGRAGNPKAARTRARAPRAGSAPPSASPGAVNSGSGPPPGDAVPAAEPVVGRPPLPEICVTGRQLYELVLEIRDVLVRANEHRCERATRERVHDDQAPLFLRGNVLCRLEHPKSELARLTPITKSAMYGLVMRESSWVKQTEQGSVPVYPPDKVAKDLIVFPPPTIPAVNAVITTPTFGREGHLLIEPGLHVQDQLWHQPDSALHIGEIPGRPTADDVAAARSLFLEHMLVDFPFAEQADRAHALAALLLPFMQRMIDGCTPLHVMEAPGAGSGKGLLCTMVSILLTGEDCTARQLPVSDDDARKMLTAELLMARPLILLDNARDTTVVSSPALAAVLTTRSWSDRILGFSEMVTVANHAMWMMTGNNLKLARDIARRSIRIRIDPKVDRPWLRADFKHDPLEEWAKDHRNELVRAALVLIQSWIAAERPRSRARLGSFQQWAHIMGGLLDVIGVPGFLENLDALYTHSDDEQTAWREFTEVWWEIHGSTPVHASVLLGLCEKQDLLANVLGDGSTRAQQTRLGRALQRARDRTFGELRVVIGTADRKSRTLYSLEQVSDAGSPAAPCNARLAEAESRPAREAHWIPFEDEAD